MRLPVIKNVNQFYDGQPYSIHLDLVAFYSIKFSYILEKMTNYDTICSIIASSYTHDLIEDARETYNDILNNTNKIIAISHLQLLMKRDVIERT